MPMPPLLRHLRLPSLLSFSRPASSSADPVSSLCSPERLRALLARASDDAAALELLDLCSSLSPSLPRRILSASPTLPLTPRSLTLLLRRFASSHLPLALSLFRRSVARGLDPEPASYRFLAQALCRRAQPVSAAELLAEMLNRGLVPDSLAYASVLHGLCRRGRLREAWKILSRMKEKGRAPDVLHFNTIISAFCRAGRAGFARQMFDEMPLHGCAPDLVTYTVLVNGLCSEGSLDDARGLLEEMVGNGFVPHFSVFHGLAKGLCGVGRGLEACGVVGQMLRIGVRPHVETWEAVVPLVSGDEPQWMVAGAVDKLVLGEDEWRKSTRIVDAGCSLEEYMVEKFQAKRSRSWRR